jgi:photosystem II stability/assembly factor-like uncharacterized protein
MIRRYWYFALVALAVILVFLKGNHVEEKIYPQPQNGTMVKTDMEEKDLKSDRHRWIEAMHKAAPGVDWRKVEYRNSMERQERSGKLGVGSRNGKVEIAQGLVSGEWLERGSNNQAGSVFDVDYDPESNEIFLVSAGGSLFKTELYFQYWEVVNDRFRFSPGLLKILIRDNGTKRLVALINKEPHFSDDMGETWTSAGAYQADNWGNIKDAFVSQKNGGDVIFILAKTSYWNDFKLYASYDQGESYRVLHSFNTSDGKNLAMTHIEKTGDIYLIEQIAANKSKFHHYNPVTEELELIRANSPLAFGSSGRGNLAGATIGTDTLKLFSYNEDLELFSSIDTAATWQWESTLPINPWEVRLYVSTENPDLLLIGAVECYRSLNGGVSWNLINGWAEYYGDVNRKLHADIMQFDEFVDQEGNTFITISNHGGISMSYDYTLSNDNIGLYDLNVSQYYSVRTSPKDPYFVTAGSQDQGLQRGNISSTLTVPLDQVISGDYGHNVFTMGGDRFWTVYPGGWVSHYSNPRFGYLDASWELNSNNETVWIPPICAGPDPAKDEVILAGGELNGGDGSHLIKLTYVNGGIQKEQLPVDFLALSGSEISAISISSLQPDHWYVATNNGQFYYSSDGGQSFSQSNANVAGSHYLYGACILPSKIDENTIYLSGSGYSTAGVLKSVDGGKNFGSMTNGLPSTMVFALAANEDESLLFAATEAGPFVFVKAEGKWYDMAGEVAPTQSYWSVEYVQATQTARFGTYGRGIWDFDIEDSEVNTEDLKKADPDLRLYPNPAQDFIKIQTDASSASLPYRVFNTSGFTVMEGEISLSGGSGILSIKDLASGNYILQLQGAKDSRSRKFIKY